MFTDEIAGSKNYLDLFSPIKSLDYEVQSIIDKECIDGIPPVKLYHPQVKRSVIEHYSLSFVVLCDRACYDDKTEVLTKNGWKLFKDTIQDDLFACLDDNNNIFYSKQHEELIAKDFSGKLLEFKSSNIDLCVTPNHKMWVFDYDKRSEKSRTWKFISAKYLNNSRYTFDKTGKWNGNEITFDIPKHKTKFNQFKNLKFSGEKALLFLELLGIWAADGCYKHGNKSGSSNNIVITQTKQSVIDRINYICKELKIKIYWSGRNAYIDNDRIYSYVGLLFGLGPKSYTLKVPELIKNATKEQIESFVTGVILGDGNIHKTNKHRVVYTSSIDFANDLQELFLKIGLSANIRKIKARDREFPNGKISKCKDSYVVSVCEEKRSKPLLDKRSAKSFGKEIEYNGKVYCVTVPYHRLYVRKNGKAVWCGNTSHEIVRHRIGTSYTQLSQRYVSYADVSKPVPVVISPDYNVDEVCLITDAAITAVSEYRGAVLYSGIKAEVARQVLPNAIGTIIVMTFNPRSLRHFLELRMSKAAYSPIRCIANEIYDIMIDSGLEILVKEYEDLRKYDPRIKNYSIETED